MTIISWAAIRPIEDTPLENGGFSYYRDERYWAKARYYYSMWDGSLNNENIYKKAYIFINNISKVVSKISRPAKGRLLYYSILGGNFG